MATRILIVNDTAEILDMFRVVLEDEGYEVVLFSFPLRKIEDIEALHPDLIILDLIFGGEKLGWQMLEMLKLQRSTNAIPVIVCTAAAQTVRDQEGYLASQGVRVLYKPFDLDDLLAMIKQATATNKDAMKNKEP